MKMCVCVCVCVSGEVDTIIGRDERGFSWMEMIFLCEEDRLFERGRDWLVERGIT